MRRPPSTGSGCRRRDASCTLPTTTREDTAFVGGSKVLRPGDWARTTEAGGVSPGKVNILDAWEAVDQPGTRRSCTWRFTREDATGTAAITFELNRDGGSGTTAVPRSRVVRLGTCWRSTLPHGNASTSTPSRSGSPWTPIPRRAVRRPGGSSDGRRSRGDAAQGAVNSRPITSRLPGQFAVGSQVPTAKFSEVALNLARAAGETRSTTSASRSGHSGRIRARRTRTTPTCRTSSHRARGACASCSAWDRSSSISTPTGFATWGSRGFRVFLIWADYDDDGVRDSGSRSRSPTTTVAT